MGKLVEVYLGVVDLNRLVHDPLRCLDVKPVQIGIPTMVGLRMARVSASGGDKVALFYQDQVELSLQIGGVEIKTADDLLVRAFDDHNQALFWVCAELLRRKPSKIAVTHLSPVH